MDPSTVFPIEVLQKVFEHCLLDWPSVDHAQCFIRGPSQSLDLSDGLWVLGRVNSAWRCATLSSNTLWSTVRITFSWLPLYQGQFWAIRRPPFSHGSNTASKILTEILHRSGSAPLSITLSLPLEIPRKEIFSDSVSSSLFALLSAQRYRWQSMELTAPQPIWRDFAQTSPSRLQALRSLRATVQNENFISPIISVCASVVDLTICAFYGDHTALPHIPTRMPFLQHLNIRSTHGYVLDAITAPCLQSLVLRLRTWGFLNSMSPMFRSRFIDFAQRSRCSNSLTALHFFGSNLNCRELVIILSSTSSDDASVPLLLPNLHALSFDSPDTLWVADVDFIFDMVEFRFLGG
ncbi:hypothetical protein EDD18DRAFT_1217618 [Armillaria luteobubalina]|uniref:F-box domain-containing protein n=1 Tax=Armillaria luteobubalina TaxID=153913 RepID=A0AA39UAW8_9AGAR|nr:hypothetical protein EDD18DRAFT_1217618 [Armillaria luteobubalina]